jgi:hypothetical protein
MTYSRKCGKLLDASMSTLSLSPAMPFMINLRNLGRHSPINLTVLLVTRVKDKLRCL